MHTSNGMAPADPSPLRHAVVAVTALAAILLYLDRVCISVSEVYIRESLGIGTEEMSWVLGAFFLAYGLAQVPTGWLSDRFGPRPMLIIYILAWSLFTAATGLVVGLLTLLAVRLAFGAAQAGAYPTAAVIVARWVPAASRGRASSIVALGGRIGGAAAPVLTAFLLTALVPSNSSRLDEGDLLDPPKLCRQLSQSGDDPPALLGRHFLERMSALDRATVKDLAALDAGDRSDPEQRELLRKSLNRLLALPELTSELDWSLVSLSREVRGLLAKPPKFRSQSETERLNRLALEAAFPGTIRQLHGRAWRSVMMLYGALGLLVAATFWFVVPPAPTRSVSQAIPWRLLIESPNMWLSGFMQCCLNIGWVFLITLLPRYLAEAHKVPIEERGTMATVPLLASCVGMFLGGRLTDRLALVLGRRWGRALPMGLMPLVCAVACLICPSLPGAWSVITALAMMALAVDLGVPAIWAFAQDTGGRHTGAALGWGNMWGNLGAALSPVLLSRIETRGGWTAVFVTCALSFFLAGAAGLLIDATRPLEPRPDGEG